MKKDISIHKMTQAQLKKKLAELEDSWDRTSTYGSPFGANATKAELYDLEKEIKVVKDLVKDDSVVNSMKKNIKTNVNCCARCGEDHNEVLFRKFTHVNGHYSHWASCPSNGEPILMKIVECNDEDDEPTGA